MLRRQLAVGLAAAVATVLVVLDVIARVSVVSPQHQPVALLGRETGSVGGSDALRAKLRASVDKQRQLGDKVHALVAAAAMFKGKRQALAQEDDRQGGNSQAEMIAHLKSEVEKQANVIAKLEAPAAEADADVDDAEQPPVPMVNAADDAVAPIYGGGGVREASAERGPTSGSSGPDEGMWRDDEASSDETFDMGTNMAFLGDKAEEGGEVPVSGRRRAIAPASAAAPPSPHKKAAPGKVSRADSEEKKQKESGSAAAKTPAAVKKEAAAAPVVHHEAAAAAAAAAAVGDGSAKQGQSESSEGGVHAVEEDEKPPIDSFAMAKFANNVDFGVGALGTNVVWMYDDLAKKGQYKKVENETPDDSLDDDSAGYESYDSSYKAPQQALRAATRGRKVAVKGRNRVGSDQSNYHQAGPPLKMVSERARLVQLAQMDGKLSSWNKPFVDPYVPPKDLYIYWGSTSAKGTVASQLTGGAGRASSAQRVRQVLHFGTFFGNHYGDDVTGHGHFLQSLEGQRFEAMSLECCSTLIVPPMENDLPLYGDNSDMAHRIRTYVSNGNNLVLTGGDYSSLVFLNKYFHYEIKKEVFDNGPFERLSEKDLPSDLKGMFKDVVATLPQEGLSVTSVKKSSLPTGTKVIYQTPKTTPMFQTTYCQAQRKKDDCKIAKAAGKSCLMDVTSAKECAALDKKGQTCSCGRILYIGYDFVGHHSSTIGTGLWDDTLRAAAAVPKAGKPGPGKLD